MTKTALTPDPELVAVYAELAELTKPKCGACLAPFACCTTANCEAAADLAREVFGIDPVPGSGRLPFLGENGCTLEPYMRPLCTVHVCDTHLSADPKFADAYYDLRERAGDLLMEHETRRLNQ